MMRMTYSGQKKSGGRRRAKVKSTSSGCWFFIQLNLLSALPIVPLGKWTVVDIQTAGAIPAAPGAVEVHTRLWHSRLWIPVRHALVPLLHIAPTRALVKIILMPVEWGIARVHHFVPISAVLLNQSLEIAHVPHRRAPDRRVSKRNFRR